ncbi:putative circularly permuted ATP-grasp superfamily protein [Flavobacterium sp. 1]|uniref:circularly permuted type 2 ATP-grasp protein n=1 Tax=Flavobacterium sp. 1 TaxID=2035200 RepID=UPI000C238A2F|nr:circularly permuted type 2 ATP-grasp protein [Flavobacterium sp. 1]PJJ09471.1 putative circularly permuted ATP-grasp superfamily protein [Flavobacterium sp. 1]
MIQDISLGLLHSYKEKINSYDEVLDQNGEIKPYWKGLFDTLESIGIDELELRNQEIVKKLKENGVTYNVYDANQESNRAWKLDPIPFLIHESEWKTIERGLKQRAHLLDLILKDLYGNQSLVKNAIIPAELVFDNSGFLLPCFDIRQKHDKQLLNYAVDLARGPDGKMWLLDNRTQSPSGAGYALENRVVMSKVFPELNEKTYRKRLSPYFSQLQQTVDTLGNNTNENPNVVFLTPGPGNETYFEHVYLSSYLGYTLVQGNDLLVRDGFVWLKSIDQLERVDVIIKRLDDVWCDPLELRRDSLLGIPGLLQVIRLGNISVMNPPGTSILENYGLMAFMQNACKFLLKEPLLISSIATWWCGQTKELDFVLANLPKLIIKKTNRKQGFRSIYARLLNKEQLEDLKNLIRKNPKDYVAQEEVSLSTTPAFVNGTIEPRYAAIRAFLIADGDDYQVMQGGLTRSSAVKDKFEISNQLGGISKDTWIITDAPTEYQEKTVERKNTNNQLNNSLTSRNAENLFWLGRLCERTMALRSFLKIILNRLNENVVKHGNEQPEFLVVLLKSLTHLTQTYPGFVGKEAKDGEVFDNEAIFVNSITELLLLINDSKKIGSVVYNMQSLLNTINQVSEKWNNDTRQIINLLEEIHFTLKNTNNINHVNHALDKLHIRLFSFYGNIYETLPRDNGFYLMEAGKNVERFLSLISVFRSAFNYKKAEEDEAVLMEAILENHHLLAQYRNIYKSHLSLKAVINMVFLEKNLTYTLSFLLNTLTHYLSKLPKTNEPNRLSIAEKSALKASTIINLIDADSLIQVDEMTQFRPELDQTLSDVFELICNVSNNLSSLYFNHSVIQHSVLDTLENSESDEI